MDIDSEAKFRLDEIVLNSKRFLQLCWSGFILSYGLAQANSFEYTGHTESPFLERWHPPAAAAETMKPVLELRAISVENGVPWLTFYNSAGKKWFTGKPGDIVGDYKIASFDLETGNAALVAGGKSLTIFYKGDKLSPKSGSPAVELASLERPPQIGSPLLSASESARLEQVSSMIRQQLELQKLRQTGRAGS